MVDGIWAREDGGLLSPCASSGPEGTRCDS